MESRFLSLLIGLPYAAMVLFTGVALADGVMVQPEAIFVGTQPKDSGSNPIAADFGDKQRLIDQSGLVYLDGTFANYVDATTDFDDYLASSPGHMHLRTTPEAWGPYEDFGDLGFASNAASSPGGIGIDLGETYTVTHLVLWTFTTVALDVWSNDSLVPDTNFSPGQGIFSVTNVKREVLGSIEAHTVDSPAVIEFTEPITTRYLAMQVWFQSLPLAFHEFAFGVDADPLPVTLDLGDTPLPVTVPGRLSGAQGDIQDVTPFRLAPGMQLSSIEVEVPELADGSIAFWLEDDQGNLLSDKAVFSDVFTGEITDFDPLLPPGEYRLVADIGVGSQASATYAYTLTTIPEPATLALLAVGAGLLLKKQRHAAADPAHPGNTP